MKYLLLASLSLMMFCSCATVNYETALPSQQLNSPLPEEKTRVVFFNDSNKALYFDGSWRIGIKIDGKGVANLHFNQFVQVYLSPGTHSFELSHFDLFTFRDKYSFEVGKKTMYIKVYNRPISTKFQILQRKPDEFESNYFPCL